MDLIFADDKQRPLVLILSGVTGAGKTELSLDLARKLNAEIIICDSMQVYAGLSVGTAAPSEEEQRLVPHHLVGSVPIGRDYSVADYVTDALACIQEILNRDRLPMLVGGTYQYIYALSKNIDFKQTGFGRQDASYQNLELLWDDLDNTALHAALAERDPEAAAALHPNNRKRVLRALVAYEGTGGLTKRERNRASRQEESPYFFRHYAVDRSPDVLDERLARRIEHMLKIGLLDECQSLLQQEENLGHSAGQAIAYKEFLPYLRGEERLVEAAQRLLIRSRQYAKRQRTWLNKFPSAQRLLDLSNEEMLDFILEDLEKFRVSQS